MLVRIKEIYATNNTLIDENEKLISKGDLKLNHIEMQKNMIFIENFTGMNLEIISENLVDTQHLFIQEGKIGKWEVELNSQSDYSQVHSFKIKFKDTLLKIDDIVNVNIDANLTKYYYQIHDQNDNIKIEEISDKEIDEKRPYIVCFTTSLPAHKTLTFSSPIIIENLIDRPLYVNR